MPMVVRVCHIDVADAGGCCHAGGVRGGFVFFHAAMQQFTGGSDTRYAGDPCCTGTSAATLSAGG